MAVNLNTNYGQSSRFTANVASDNEYSTEPRTDHSCFHNIPHFFDESSTYNRAHSTSMNHQLLNEYNLDPAHSERLHTHNSPNNSTTTSSTSTSSSDRVILINCQIQSSTETLAVRESKGFLMTLIRFVVAASAHGICLCMGSENSLFCRCGKFKAIVFLIGADRLFSVYFTTEYMPCGPCLLSSSVGYLKQISV